MKYFLTIMMIQVFVVSTTIASNDNNIEQENWINIYITTITDAKKNPELYNDISIDDGDSEVECYKKLLRFSVLFWSAPSVDKQKKMLSMGEKALKMHPSSAAIASRHVIYYYNSNIIQNASESILMLSSFLNQNNPYVVFSLWYIFDSLERNYGNKKSSDGITEPFKLIDAVQNVELAKYRFNLLKEFWLSKSIYGIKDEKFDKQITDARKKFMSKEYELEALYCWSIILKNASKEHIENIELMKEKQRQKEERNKIMLKVKKREEEEENLLGQAIENLKVFEKTPNSLQKIELTFNKVTQFRRQLKQHPDIPNYEELKKSIGEYEAEVINIAYKAYILRESKECLIKIKELDHKLSDNDPRILAIGIYCMQKEKYPVPQIIDTINQLLKLEPNNQRAFMLKKMLEAQEEFNKNQSSR